MARFFDGTNDYLEAPVAVATGTSFTMSCWFKTDDSATRQTLISLADSTTEDSFFALQAAGDLSGNPIVARVQDVFGTTASTTSGYVVGEWHHAAGIFSSGSDRSVFLDGGSKGTQAASVTPRNPLTRTSVGRVGNLSGADYFKGEIAEVAAWNIELPEEEIAMLAKGFSPLLLTNRLKNLVLYQDLIRPVNRPGFGPVLTDNGTAEERPCQPNRARLFDGSSGYVKGPEAEMGTSDWSVVVSFKTGSNAFTGLAGVFEFAGTSGRAGIYVSTSTQLKAIFAPSTAAFTAASSSVFADNQWHKAIATYDRDGDMVLYLDGIEQDRTDISAWSGTNLDSPDLTFDLGHYNANGPVPGNFFDGEISDVRLLTRVLTLAEIADFSDLSKATSTALDTVLHYKLDETHPTLAYDSSGNGLHGTINGGVLADDTASTPYSFANEVGYSDSANGPVPRNESATALDVLGNTLGNVGPCTIHEHPPMIYPSSPMVRLPIRPLFFPPYFLELAEVEASPLEKGWAATTGVEQGATYSLGEVNS